MSATAQPARRSDAPTIALTPLTRQSDHRLVELSRSGDERAFETLVRRHHHELRVYAGRLVGAQGRAEDALQHALMSAWVALRDRDATVANPRAWLYGIVHNSAVTMLRRACHDTVALNDALDAPHTPDRPDVHLVVGEILAGLSAMPEPQRRALLMTSVAGASHEEAATALGVSGGAVRGMVYRARAALRQAAAALLPGPLWGWAARLAHRRPHVPLDPTDAATAVTSASAGAAGAAALVVKGGAIVAAVGALAGTGGALLPALSGPSHHRAPAVHRRPSPRRLGAGVRPAAAALPLPRPAEPHGVPARLISSAATDGSRDTSVRGGRHESQSRGGPSPSSSRGGPSSSRGGPSSSRGGPSDPRGGTSDSHGGPPSSEGGTSSGSASSPSASEGSSPDGSHDGRGPSPGATGASDSSGSGSSGSSGSASGRSGSDDSATATPTATATTPTAATTPTTASSSPGGPDDTNGSSGSDSSGSSDSPGGSNGSDGSGSSGRTPSGNG